MSLHESNSRSTFEKRDQDLRIYNNYIEDSPTELDDLAEFGKTTNYISDKTCNGRIVY
jgi:hypothetical protein